MLENDFFFLEFRNIFSNGLILYNRTVFSNCAFQRIIFVKICIAVVDQQLKGRIFQDGASGEAHYYRSSAVYQLSTCLSTVAMNALRERHPIAIKVATRKHNSLQLAFMRVFSSKLPFHMSKSTQEHPFLYIYIYIYLASKSLVQSRRK